MRLIFNPSSGQGGREKSEQEELRRRLSQLGKVDCVDGENGPDKLAEGAINEGETLLIACGGDGTVNAVAGAVVGKDAALGVIPTGTLNHFARDAGIPLKLEDSIKTIQEGHVRQIDVAEVNGQVFLNSSCIGLYPSLVRFREHQEKIASHGRIRATAEALWRALRTQRPLQLEIEANGKRISERTSFIFVGNNIYDEGGLRGRSRLDEGVLTWITASEPGRLRLVLIAVRSLLGLARKAPDLELQTSRELTLRSRHTRLPVSYDGEVSDMAAPLYYRNLPRALRLVASESPD